MRDELRERLSVATMPEMGDDGEWVIPADVEDRLLAALEAFMREHGLKMMAEPIKDRRHYLAKKWWDAAPLTPWEGKDA
jgi:hypothetical protein